MTNQEIMQEKFNGLVGAVLAMLKENDASRTLKSAVRAEIYILCDKTAMPMAADLDSRQGDQEDEPNGNRA